MEMHDDILDIEDGTKPDEIFIRNFGEFKGRWFKKDIELCHQYHHDRVLKAKDAEIAELKAYIESRGYDVPR